MRKVKTEDLPEILQQIKGAYKADEDFGRIVEIKNPDKYDNPRHADKHFPEYSLKQGLLFKGDRICVPRSMRQQVMQESHDVPTAGHPGGRRMYIAVRENFYWPNMKKEVEDYVKTCKTCQTSKATNQRKAGLLKPLPVPVAA